MGESNLFDNVRDLPGPIWFKNKIKLRLSDIYNQKWSSDKTNNSVCLNYRLMTDQKTLQKYFNLPRQHMYALCKFKCANSRIPTITGRYSNKPLEDRTCTVCESNEIGDEIHYLFKCSKFHEARSKYIKNFYCRHPSGNRMFELFNSKNKKQMLDLAKFISEVLEVFKK